MWFVCVFDLKLEIAFGTLGSTIQVVGTYALVCPPFNRFPVRTSIFGIRCRMQLKCRHPHQKQTKAKGIYSNQSSPYAPSPRRPSSVSGPPSRLSCFFPPLYNPNSPWILSSSQRKLDLESSNCLQCSGDLVVHGFATDLGLDDAVCEVGGVVDVGVEHWGGGCALCV